MSNDSEPVHRSGSTVLITGGTGGIGFHAARLLAAGGHEVAITGRNVQRGEEAVVRIRTEAPRRRVTFLAADHSTVGGNQTLAGQVDSTFPRLDVLINNRAVADRGGTARYRS